MLTRDRDGGPLQTTQIFFASAVETIGTSTDIGHSSFNVDSRRSISEKN